MKKLLYTTHLLCRVKQRHISKTIIEDVVRKPLTIFFDTLNKTQIAIGKCNAVFYMVAYFETPEYIKILTSHRIKKSQIINRVKSKRWKNIV